MENGDKVYQRKVWKIICRFNKCKSSLFYRLQLKKHTQTHTSRYNLEMLPSIYLGNYSWILVIALTRPAFISNLFFPLKVWSSFGKFSIDRFCSILLFPLENHIQGSWKNCWAGKYVIKCIIKSAEFLCQNHCVYAIVIALPLISMHCGS